VRYAPDEALASLPQLLRNDDDRARLVTLVRTLLGDERVQRAKPSREQLEMIAHLGETLSVKAQTRNSRKPTRKTRKAPRRASVGARP
jgi:uncharacterized membrane protein affecting hemolysin expression